MNPIIWHNPRCSKSRQALELLNEHGSEPTIRLYLKDAPTAREIKEALEHLNLSAHQIMRKGESAWKELELSEEKAEDDLIAAMVAHPILIERPIIFTDLGAVVARPLDRMSEIL